MRKKTIILGLFIILKFFLQYILLNSQYDLHRDEYLHLDQGSHLAWGYISVPPLTSWTSFIIKLLGDSVFWVKFFPALYGALTILIVWKTIEELNGNLFALILGATCILFSVLLRINILYQPNSLDILLWTVFYFVAIKYFNSAKQKWLFIGAIVFAFAFLNKYNILFLTIGFLPAILITPQRTLLANKKLYVAILLALLLILPNLLWQYNNHFPVVHHMKELAETQLVNVDRLGFLRAQLMFFLGGLLVILAGLYALLLYKPFQKFRSFFWALIFTLVVFIYLRAKDYYAIGLYPIYIAFGSVYLASILKNGWLKWLRPIAIAIPVLLFIPMYNLAFPNKSIVYMLKNQKRYKDFGLLRWEDGKDHTLPQDFADMLGWKELAGKVDKIYSSFPDAGETLVLCDNYGEAGAITYYTHQKIRAVSFNGDYINWFKLDHPYKNLIRVKEYKDVSVEMEKTSPYFTNSFAADSITNQFAREFGTVIFVFKEAKVDIGKRMGQEIAERKQQ